MTDQTERDPVQVVQAQLEALNAHDLNAFVAAVSQDITVTDAEGRVLLSGKESLHRWYSEHFASHPNLKADLLDRMSLGGWVVDEVLLSGFADASQMHVISVIRVERDQVTSIRLIRG